MLLTVKATGYEVESILAKASSPREAAEKIFEKGFCKWNSDGSGEWVMGSKIERVVVIRPDKPTLLFEGKHASKKAKRGIKKKTRKRN